MSTEDERSTESQEDHQVYDEALSISKHLEQRFGLPRKSYYLSEELAVAFNTSRTSVQRTAKKYGIGKLSKRELGGRGVRIFFPEDVMKLSKVREG